MTESQIAFLAPLKRERERVNGLSWFFGFLTSLPQVSKFVFVFALLGGGFLFAKSASAATYYVSNTASNGYEIGNNSNTTVQAQNKATPWLTLMGAESKATTGDTIYVNLGTYTEVSNVVFTNGISWIADGGAVTITNGGAGAYAGAFTGNGNTASINGFTFNGTGKTYGFQFSNGSNSKSLINCTFTTNGTYILYFAGTHDSITLQNNIFNGTPSAAGILASNPTNLNASGNSHNYTSARGYYITADTGTISITDDIWNATLTNKVIDLLGTGSITITGHSGLISGAASSFLNIATAGKNGSIVLSNNILSFSGATVGAWARIVAGSHAVTVSDNNITKSAATETNQFVYVLNQPSPIIDGNVFTAENTNANSIVGIEIASTGTEVGVAQITSNTITSSQVGKQLILVGTDTSGAGDNKINGAIITGNLLYSSLDANTHVIEYGYNNNGTVTGNYIYGGGYGIVIKGNNDLYTTGRIANNILKDQALEQLRIKGQRDVPVYNNTFYISSGRSITNGSLYITINGDSANVPATGVIVRNNLFYTQGGLNAVNVDSDSSTGLTLNYNSYYLATGISPIYSLIGAVQYQGAAAWTNWQTAGYDANGASGSDPLFINPIAANFDLQATSIAIDTGTDVSLITDYAGNPIYGTPDMGVYEYQPPHSLIIATPDTIDIGAGARVYADGKFRDLAATNSAVAHLKVTPSGGSFTAYDATTTRPAYLDITGISSWTNAHKTWIENNAQDAGMVTDHTIGDLNSNKYYTISVTGASASNITGINGTTCSNAVCLSSGGGTLSFRYDGGYSAHTFDMVEDTTAPTNIGLSSITVNSTSQLTILAQTATDASSGLPAAPYWFTESTSNPGGSSSSDWQTSTTFVDSVLSPNTMYTYTVKARDANANESAPSATLSAYTLAAVPTNLSATAGKTTITLTVDSLPNDTSGSSGYYFSRTGANSGWIQVNSWQDTNLLCGHIYTYSVIYRNGDGTETTPISIDKQTQGCGSSTSGSGSSGGSSGAADTYTLTFNTPTSTDALTGNDTTIIDYASTPTYVGGSSTVSLFYSLDDGLNWTTLATGLEPTGTYVWTVPNQATGQARLRANVYESAGAILTTTESGDFTIVAVAESSTSPDQEVGDSLFPIVTSSSSASDLSAGITTDVNGRRQAPASATYGLSPFDGSTELVSTVQAGWLVRSPNYSTVYYLDANLDRHVFWDAQTYFTWSDSWDDVVWVTNATLPTLALGSPMLPKPGVVLIKLQSDPAVYKIESDSLTGDYLLRHITSESVAMEMYGSAWADYVLDEDPTMMAHFLRGSAVTGAESVDLSIMKTRAEIAELVR